MRWCLAVSLGIVWWTGLTGFTQGAPPPRTGLDLAALDTAVRPQDDLYRFVNAGWLDQTSIPPDRVTHGTFTELVERAQADVRAIIEESASLPKRRVGSAAQQVGDLYASMMNEARLDALGASPILPQLRRIEAITSARGVAAEAGYLSSIAAGGPFSGTVAVDAVNPRALVVTIGQGGTLLPDRNDYLRADAASADIRAQYELYLATIFSLVGRPAARDEAAAVLAFETTLAGALWSTVEGRRPVTVANRFSLGQLRTEMPGFDWRAWAEPQGIDLARDLILLQPPFFKHFADVVGQTPLDTLKAWLRARFITASAPYLSRAFNDARFAFFGRRLSGQEEPITRWKRGVSLVNGSLGDSVGRLYVERHFSPAARTSVERIVAQVRAAFGEAIAASDWLAAPTKKTALAKLARLTTRVGYPDAWRDYTRLAIKPDDLFGNVQRTQQFISASRNERLARAAQTGQWLMNPQSVNAYYSPASHEIVLPAGILQPPLFDETVDDAENFGAIGSVIGHEIGHGFDEQGRTFDGRVDVRDWWTAADADRFRHRATRLVEQVNVYRPLPGMHVNGELTRAENIGDLAGLAIAYRAYRRSLGGGASPVIGGFSGEQRFFMSWARTWRSKERDEYMRQWLLSNPYSPARYRANGPVSNMPAFYEAFGVKPGDRLYREPAARVTIW